MPNLITAEKNLNKKGFDIPLDDDRRWLVDIIHEIFKSAALSDGTNLRTNNTASPSGSQCLTTI